MEPQICGWYTEGCQCTVAVLCWASWKVYTSHYRLDGKYTVFCFLTFKCVLYCLLYAEN